MYIAFGTQLIGRTEKALNGILGRLLDGSGVSEPQWVTLNVAIAAAEPSDQAALTHRVAGVLKVRESDARAHVVALAERGFLDVQEGGVDVTDAGRGFRESIAGVITEITGRLWGDVSAEDLHVAAQVLNTVLSRVEGELALL